VIDEDRTFEIANILLEIGPYLPDKQVGHAVITALILDAGSTFRLGHGKPLQNGPDAILQLLAERVRAGRPRLRDLLAAEDKVRRSEILDLLFSYNAISPESVLPLVDEFIGSSSRAWLLSSLVRKCVEPERTALAAAMLREVRVADVGTRASILCDVLDAVPPELWAEAFIIAKAIPRLDSSSVIHPTIISAFGKLLALAPANKRMEAEEELWKAIQRDLDDKSNAREIGEVAGLLPPSLQTTLVVSHRLFSDEYDQVAILGAVAATASGDLLALVLSASGDLSPSARAMVLARLPPEKREEYRDEFHKTVLALPDPKHQVQLLVSMVSWAPGAMKRQLLAEALELAGKINEWHWWYQSTNKLLPNLPVVMRTSLPNIAKQLTDSDAKAELLCGLVDLLDRSRLPELLLISRDIVVPKNRVKALAKLIPKFATSSRHELIQEAMDISSIAEGESDKIFCSLEVLRFLPLEEQRITVDKIFELFSDAEREDRGRPYFSVRGRDGWVVRRYIGELATAIDNELLPDLFSRIRDLPSSWPDFFEAAASRLPLEYHEEILTSLANLFELNVDKDSIPYICGASITHLAGRLDPSLHLMAVEAVETVPKHGWRTSAFSALLPFLSERLRVRVLQNMLQDGLVKRGRDDRGGGRVLDLVIHLRVEERRALFSGAIAVDYQATVQGEVAIIRATWLEELRRVRPRDRARLWALLFSDIASLYEPRAGAGIDVWGRLDLGHLSDDRERALEGKRFADLVIYRGQLASDQLPNAEPLKDDVPLFADCDYTLEVAIRLERKGIEANLDPAREVKNPRIAKEPLTIEVIVTSDDPSFELRSSVAPITWPYQEDSSSALFHFKVRPSGAAAWPVEVEVRFHHRLDYLDVIRLWLPMVAKKSIKQAPLPPSEFGGRRLSWTNIEDCFEAVDVRARERALSIVVSRRDSLYRFRFAYKLPGDKVTVLQFRRVLTEADLNALLVRIRTLWTKLAITHYETNLSATASTYRSYTTQLTACGREAWRLLFGDRIGDERGESEAVGDVVSKLALPDGALIQIVYDDEATNFAFPWNILCAPSHAYAEDDPQQFWGSRYQIEQVRDGPRSDGQSDDSVDVAFVLDSGFGNSDEQIKFFEQLKEKASNRLNVSEPISLRRTLFSELSRTPSPNLYYFFCHGYAPSQLPALRFDGWKELKGIVDMIPEDAPERKAWNYYIGLEPGEGLEPWIFVGGAKIKQSELADQKFFLGERRPIVFLNMCQSADLSPTMTTGLVRFLLDRRAAAVIGTESPISSVTAHAFGSVFLENLLLARDVGTALQAARRSLLFGAVRNPLALAYTLYGRATTRACRSPIIPDREDN